MENMERENEDKVASENEEDADKVAEELAEADFDRFCKTQDAYSTAHLIENPQELLAFREHRFYFIRAVKEGSLVVNEDGTATYTTSRGDVLTFKEPTTKQVVLMKKSKDDDDFLAGLKIMCGFKKDISLPTREMKIINACTMGFF